MNMNHFNIAGKETSSVQSNSLDAKTNLANQILDQINSGMEELSEEKRQKMDAKILAKLESGKKLSEKEMQYLRKYNPALYAKALRIQLKIKHLEEQLKHAKSKEEVTTIETFAIGSISKNDPDRKALIAAINNVMQDFKSSKAYQNLPVREEDGRNIQNGWKPEAAEDEDADKEQEFGTNICYSAEHGGYQILFANTNSAAVWNTTP